MKSFTSSNIIVISTMVLCLFIAVPSATGKIQKDTAGLYRNNTDTVGQTKPTKPAGVPKPHDNHHNALYPSTPTASGEARNRTRTRTRTRKVQRDGSRRKNATKPTAGAGNLKTRSRAATRTTSGKRRRQNEQPTPDPTGAASTSTTVYINGADAFALLLPNSGEMVSSAEQDAIAYCTDGSGCGNSFPQGLITGAAYSTASDGSYVQITGCMDASQFPFASGDDGGQFDSRFPNGAQCTFGGYGASFIEQVEPSANRFCLRCCKAADDQENCNSHQDRAGCPAAIPGTYAFGEVTCS